jgi:hypothetical protein
LDYWSANIASGNPDRPREKKWPPLKHDEALKMASKLRRSVDAETMVARFFVIQYTKTGKIYQKTTKLPKGHITYIPKGHIIYQLSIIHSIYIFQEVARGGEERIRVLSI